MMPQLILHLIGDYVTQSDWMANNKTKRFWPAAVHATVYSLPFLLLRPSWLAFLVILVTHFLIDRYRLARFVVRAKNVIGDPAFWSETNMEIREKLVPKFSTDTGYPAEAPAWLTVWLLIAADNTLHLAINYLALTFL
jgi:hypothetical protein